MYFLARAMPNLQLDHTHTQTHTHTHARTRMHTHLAFIIEGVKNTPADWLVGWLVGFLWYVNA